VVEVNISESTETIGDLIDRDDAAGDVGRGNDDFGDAIIEAADRAVGGVEPGFYAALSNAPNLFCEMLAAVQTIPKFLVFAKGDLEQRIANAFIPELERLRLDFNASLETLAKSMESIAASGQAIRVGTSEISTASDDLSRRTEHQASSLEETTAALREITTTVKKTADGAGHAREVVAEARSTARSWAPKKTT